MIHIIEICYIGIVIKSRYFLVLKQCRKKAIEKYYFCLFTTKENRKIHLFLVIEAG